MRHTPGPWEVRQATWESPPEHGEAMIVVAATGVQGRDPGEPLWVCAVGKVNDPPEYVPGSWEDARLIAASPVLLKVAERALKRLEIVRADMTKADERVVADLRAAIAKARGEG